MGRIIGIDLGTTYSVVTLPEELAGEGFLDVKQNPGFTVILDKFKRRTTPSVVSIDKKGSVLVGHKAKSRAGMCPPPIMFAKRFMGEDKTFQLSDDKVLKPEEVSAEILKYLKSMAEERLGEPIEEAVITVPAYFSLKAKQLTELAGQMAGLNVKKIAQEPVAAALMYCCRDSRDPITIMTYDLGGGTFDVAILKKRDGTISSDSILSFDGDRFLGGYNFDKKLAFWLMDKLNSEGYDLHLDLDNPSDNAIFAKLMVYAERAKVSLSQSEVYAFEEITTGITDHSDNEVTIEFEVSRKDFNDLIEEDIDYSVSICLRAMEKASLTSADIDEIIMVGGSSFIPLVSEKLEMAFDKKPQLIEPNLCVALGAGILAGSVDTGEMIGTCLKLGAIPTQTDLPDILVTGEIIKTETIQEIEGCIVSLKTADGSYNSKRKTNDQGVFTFDSVPLIEDDTTDFVLTVVSVTLGELASHRFSVEQSMDAEGGLIEGGDWNVLSKPISIQGVKGLEVIFSEGTSLPTEQRVAAGTSDQSGLVTIPIVEENERLGEIRIENLPTTLPIGSDIQITLTAQKNYQIIGEAYIPSLAVKEKVVIDLPIPPVKTIEELREEFELLEEQSQDALNSAGIGAMFGGGNAKLLQQRVEHCRQLFQNRAPEAAEIQNCLSEIETLIKSLSDWKPNPPREVFNEIASQTDHLLLELIREKPELEKDGYDKLLETIRKNADKAYENQNSAAWKQEAEKLKGIFGKLKGMKQNTGSGGGEGDSQGAPPPDPKMILFQFNLMLTDLEKKVKEQDKDSAKKLYDEFSDDFQKLGSELKSIKPDAPDVMGRIQDWYKKFELLKSKIEKSEQAVGKKGLTVVKNKL